MADIFELYGPARLTPAGGETFHLLATMASQVYERRLVARKRPYVDGAPLDDTGADPRQYEISVLFADGHGRPEIPSPTYPDYHRRFMEAVEVEGTATLYMPGRGERRVRVKRVTSEQTPARRNAELVILSCWEDREDERATAGSFTQPSAKTAGPVIARQLAVSAGELGLGGDVFAAIDRFVTSLEAAASSPFDSAAEIETRAERLTAACRRVERIGTKAQDATDRLAHSPLLPPDAVGACRLLKLLQDATAAQRSALFGASSTTRRRFPRALSIFEVAAELSQPADELIRLNAGLPLFLIPAGTPVVVKATT
jgi:hypothetical protein